MSIRAYILDDEPLAVDRLIRLLEATGRVTISGSNTKPRAAIQFLGCNTVDVLFLDISMPGMTGFEVLSKLSSPPNVVFTTAYDEYALKAFEVNSIDYLLKPIEPSHLIRALNRVERARGIVSSNHASLQSLLADLSAVLKEKSAEYQRRIASRVGDRVCFLDVAEVTHFYAEDKLTYAVANGRAHCLDRSIADLEGRLDPKRFVRIHRATLVNCDWIKEIMSTLGGGLVVRLRDAQKTELRVARNRNADLKTHLGL